MKTQPCTLGPKHTWEWKKDVTLKTSSRPGMVKFSRRGAYACKCGATRYGVARSGL
jgi:hypothetical protein